MPSRIVRRIRPLLPRSVTSRGAGGAEVAPARDVGNHFDLGAARSLDRAVVGVDSGFDFAAARRVERAGAGRDGDRDFAAARSGQCHLVAPQGGFGEDRGVRGGAQAADRAVGGHRDGDVAVADVAVVESDAQDAVVRIDRHVFHQVVVGVDADFVAFVRKVDVDRVRGVQRVELRGRQLLGDDGGRCLSVRGASYSRMRRLRRSERWSGG